MEHRNLIGQDTPAQKPVIRVTENRGGRLHHATVIDDKLIRLIRLLCGSVLPYEIPVFHKALSECGSLEVRPVAICVPQEIQEYCMELFGEDVQIAAASHDLFAKRANGQIYRPLVEKYIAGEKRL